MQFAQDNVVTEYDPDKAEWHITDTTRPGMDAYTRDPALVYDVEQAFRAPAPPPPGPYRDSGDEDPYA